jgi:serine/threonine protein kinase
MIGSRYQIMGAIDRPQGGFARVYKAQDLAAQRTVAFKILRPEHLDKPEKDRPDYYAAFCREVDLLMSLRGNPKVVEIYDMGYLYAPANSSGRTYQVHKPPDGDARGFASMMREAISKKWCPYLVLKLYPSTHSLHSRVAGVHQGTPLPMIEAVEFNLQLAELLVQLHSQGVVYYDGKPAHAYWDGAQLLLIDWNVSFRVTDQNMLRKIGSDANQALLDDLVIAARTFTYPAFVGLEWDTGEPPQSPGTRSAQDVRSRAARQWQGEVDLWGAERFLDEPVKEFLSRAVQSGAYPDAGAFQADVQQCAVKLGWKLDGRFTNTTAAKALQHKRVALRHLRKALEGFMDAEEELVEADVAQSLDTKRLLEETMDIRRRFERLGL